MKILIYSNGGALASALAAQLVEGGAEVISRNPAYWRGEVEQADAVVVEGEPVILQARGLVATEANIAELLQLSEDVKPGCWYVCPAFAEEFGIDPNSQQAETEDGAGDGPGPSSGLKAVHKGRGKYDVINAAGEVVASGLDKEAAAVMTKQ